MPALATTHRHATSARPRILIVEDESVIAMDMAAQLDSLGFQVVGTAASCDRAHQLATQLRPDAVMMDIAIQGDRDGIETARLIREDTDATVIFLTAYGDKATLDRAKQVSPHGYLLKPIRPTELRATIELALQQHRLEAQLRESQSWFASTLQGISDGVIATDEHGCVRFVNRVAERLTAWHAAEAIGRPVHEVFSLADVQTHQALPDLIDQALSQRQATARVHGRLQPRRGDGMLVDAQASPTREDGGARVLGAVLVLRDSSERLSAEANLRELAQLDPLTGLHNRSSLHERLEVMLASAKRQHSQLAVLFIDLDGFKQINDSFGHDVGDAVLAEVAQRLKHTLRIDDFIARLGGDEFVLVAGNLAQEATIAEMATRLIEIVGRPCRAGDALVKVAASIGISLYPNDSSTAAGLLRLADAAMYRAKKLGGSCVVAHG